MMKVGFLDLLMCKKSSFQAISTSTSSGCIVRFRTSDWRNALWGHTSTWFHDSGWWSKAIRNIRAVSGQTLPLVICDKPNTVRCPHPHLPHRHVFFGFLLEPHRAHYEAQAQQGMSLLLGKLDRLIPIPYHHSCYQIEKARNAEGTSGRSSLTFSCVRKPPLGEIQYRRFWTYWRASSQDKVKCCMTNMIANAGEREMPPRWIMKLRAYVTMRGFNDTNHTKMSVYALEYHWDRLVVTVAMH